MHAYLSALRLCVVSGQIHWRAREAIPPRSLLAKRSRDARPIKGRFCQSQNAPKLVSLSSKIETFLGRGRGHTFFPEGGGTPLPDHLSGGKGTPLPIFQLPRRLYPRAYGSRLYLGALAQASPFAHQPHLLDPPLRSINGAI